MALMTPEQFEESLKALNPRVFMNGKPVDNILQNRNTRTVVEANKASYAWALDPTYKDIMSCRSPLIDDVVNRYTHVSAGIDDLVKKAEAGTFTAEMLGTCIYRCVVYDAFHPLAASCCESDRDLGTACPSHCDKEFALSDLSCSAELQIGGCQRTWTQMPDKTPMAGNNSNLHASHNLTVNSALRPDSVSLHPVPNRDPGNP